MFVSNKIHDVTSFKSIIFIFKICNINLNHEIDTIPCLIISKCWLLAFPFRQNYIINSKIWIKYNFFFSLFEKQIHTQERWNEILTQMHSSIKYYLNPWKKKRKKFTTVCFGENVCLFTLTKNTYICKNFSTKK